MRMPSPIGDLALALGGGGARAAYQVGVLRAIVRRSPGFQPPLLTGISAGAINTAHLANHTGDAQAKVADLERLWLTLDVNKVFETQFRKLLWRIARVGARLTVGLPPGVPDVQGMVDTRPLNRTLREALCAPDGCLPGVAANIASEKLRAVALVTTRYSTGQTVTFFEGKNVQDWERPYRRSIRTDMNVDHIMASAALPLFFPSVRVGDDWYGDGGVRMVAPLAPAVHMGASKILTISTRHGRSAEEADQRGFPGRPSPAQVMGSLFNAIFLDSLDNDALRLERINKLVRDVPTEKRGKLRDIGLLVVRPSQDLGVLANEFEPQLPPTFRYLTRRLGTKKAKSQDLMSTVMFQRDYIRQLIEMGDADATARGDEIEAFLND